MFTLHRTDDRSLDAEEGTDIFKAAIADTRYPIVLTDVIQSNGSVTGTITVVGNHQFYRIQLLLTALARRPDMRVDYQGTRE